MNEERREAVEKQFQNRLRIFSSADGQKPTEKAGIALVFNKTLINAEEVVVVEVIPGQVIMAEFPLKKGKTTRVLAVYAHNDAQKNTQMWKDLEEALSQNSSIPRPDIILGDFNMVKDAVDRIPAHEDSVQTVAEWRKLKGLLKIVDGWRETFPDRVEFTYPQKETVHLKIDRIYLTEEL
jgi:exonuclease III